MKRENKSDERQVEATQKVRTPKINNHCDQQAQQSRYSLPVLYRREKQVEK